MWFANDDVDDDLIVCMKFLQAMMMLMMMMMVLSVWCVVCRFL